MKHPFRLVILGTVLSATWTAVGSCLAADTQPTPEQLAFFEKSIRPVLVKQCYSCHSSGAEKVRGSLKLDTRDAIRKGGDHGPAVVPGDLDKSYLLKAIKHAEDVKPRCRRRWPTLRRGDRRLREVDNDGRPGPARRRRRRSPSGKSTSKKAANSGRFSRRRRRHRRT